MDMYKDLKEMKSSVDLIDNVCLLDFINKVGINKGFKNEEGNLISLSETRQKEILTEIYENIFYMSEKNKFITVTKDFNPKMLSEKDFKNELVLLRFPEIRVFQKTKVAGKDKYVERFLINLNNVISMILLLNQVEKIKYVINLWKPSSIKKNGDILTISKDDFNLKQPDIIEEEDQQLASEIIEDYIKNDPDILNEFENIIAPLFTDNRKPTYRTFLYDSDVGKSHRDGMFKEIGACAIVKFKKLLQSRSPFSAEDLFGMMYIVEDEFKVFPAEMKDITHDITIDAKGKLNSTVQVFGKKMTCAEMPSSFQGIVDVQIINRVPFFDKREKLSMLTENKYYNENTALYNLAIQNWFYYELTTLKKEYKEMGKYKSDVRAAKFIKETHKNNLIPTTGSILEGITEYVYEDLIKIISDFESKGYFNTKLINYLTISEDNKFIFIQRPKEFLAKIIELNPDKSFRGKSAYKVDKFEDILLGEYKTHYNPIYKRNMKSVKIPTKQILDYFNEDKKD